MYYWLEKSEITWETNIEEALYSVVESLKDYTEIYDLDQLRESIKQTMSVGDIKNLADGLTLVNKIFKECAPLLLYIENNMF